VRGWAAAIAMLAIGCAARNPPKAAWPPDAPGAPSAPAAVRSSADVGAPIGAARSLFDGVYTREQSARGQAIYFTSCVRCHKAEMTGTEIVPPILGDHFLDRWSRKTAADLFEWVLTKMPPVEAERLSGQQSADVLAYILSRNRFPAGDAELAADFDTLRRIRVAPESEEADSGAIPRAQPGY
jgi:cytochrome c